MWWLRSAVVLVGVVGMVTSCNWTARSSSQLQSQFEVLPNSGAVGWLGADSDISVRIGNRALWVFADTIIGSYDAATATRVRANMSMPHNTIAVLACNATCDGKPDYIWRRDLLGHPTSFFVPGPAWPSSMIIWPTSMLAGQSGAQVLITGQVGHGLAGMNGTIAILLDVANSDPLRWQYSTVLVGALPYSWSHGLFWCEAACPQADTVYLLGQKEGEPKEGSYVARSAFRAFTSSPDLEYWGGDRVWLRTPEAAMRIGLPSWETTVTHSRAAGLYYSLNIPGIRDRYVNLWTAQDIFGPWTSQRIFDLPQPFASRSDLWCYAAKAHPELGQGLAAVFTWVCNIEPNNEGEAKEIFEPGGMRLAGRVYWPRFVEVDLCPPERQLDVVVL